MSKIVVIAITIIAIVIIGGVACFPRGSGEESFFGISTKVVQEVWEGLFQDSFKWYCEDMEWDYHMLQARGDPILQTEHIRRLVDMGADGIIVSAQDRYAPISSLKYAQDKGVPVICADSDVDSVFVKMYVGFSGFRASRLLGDKVVEYLGNEVDPIGDVQGKVLEVRGPLGLASAGDRHDGFMEVMDEHPGIEVHTVDGGFMQESAKYMSIPKLASVDFDVIYVANGPMILGVINAMETIDQDPAQKFVVGIDATPRVLDAIRAGKVKYVFDQPCPFYNPIALYYLNKYLEEGSDALPKVGETITAEDLHIEPTEHKEWVWWEVPTWAPATITTREGHLWFQTAGVMVDENNCDTEWLWGNAEIQW